MRQTERHGGDVIGHKTGDERRKVLTDGAVDVVGGRVGDALDVKLGKLGDGRTELGVGNSELDLLLVLQGVEQRGEHGSDLAVGESGGLLEGSGGAVELLELLELEPEDDD